MPVQQSANLGNNFFPKLVQISSDLGMKPEDLLAVMVSESGLNPSAYESKFHGSGLLGFMPDTLKGLGYKGTWEDFTKSTGEEQLDYVKKLVQNSMHLNGGPFTSAAQYYVANLWPVALKLPGIKQGDASTAFIEENPATITDPKTGRKYSKKYYDLGFRISPESERAAYKYNPLFHGTTPGAITYGDMMKQVEKNKRNPAYQKAVASMEHSTGYKTDVSGPATDSKAPTDLVSRIESLLSKFLSAISDHQSEDMTKQSEYQFLPSHNFLIQLQADDICDALEFARVLSAACQEELQATTTTHFNPNQIEVECHLRGDHQLCSEAVLQMCEAMSHAFEQATQSVGGIQVVSHIIPNRRSNYQQLDIKVAEIGYDTFHHKIAQAQHDH